MLPQDLQIKAQVEARQEAFFLLQANTLGSGFFSQQKIAKRQRICTAESLTAGAIMASLVDVPFGGSHKFGSFDVYETSAKEKYLGVTVRQEALRASMSSQKCA